LQALRKTENIYFHTSSAQLKQNKFKTRKTNSNLRKQNKNNKRSRNKQKNKPKEPKSDNVANTIVKCINF